MKRFNLLLVFETALLLGAVNLKADSVVLTVVPGSSTVNVGSKVSVQVEISGLQGDAPNGPSLGGYEFLFSYNSADLGDPVVTFGDPILGDELALDSTPSITCIGTACGASTDFPLEIGEVSLNSIAQLNGGQAADFTLATITFTALSKGTSSLDLSDVTLADENGNALALGETVDSSIIVGSTPEPRAGVLLLAAGLIAIFARRRWSAARA